ncbi:recombinase family protein [Streptomyces collinus]|uniref:recombinase family protein n=1 Tax=Streptomyces collinus TaxID=42684 RepID=UPI0033A15AEB
MDHARGSTGGRWFDRQIDALTAAGCSWSFDDKKSGKADLRPGLKACHAFLTVGDTLVVPALGRYGHSLKDLVNISVAAEQKQGSRLRIGIQVRGACARRCQPPRRRTATRVHEVHRSTAPATTSVRAFLQSLDASRPIERFPPCGATEQKSAQLNHWPHGRTSGHRKKVRTTAALASPGYHSDGLRWSKHPDTHLQFTALLNSFVVFDKHVSDERDQFSARGSDLGTICSVRSPPTVRMDVRDRRPPALSASAVWVCR